MAISVIVMKYKPYTVISSRVESKREIVWTRDAEVNAIDISYTLDSASIYQKVKPKIPAVSPHNNIGGGHIGRSHSSKKNAT